MATTPSKPDPAGDSPGSVIALLLPGYSPDLAWMARALNADRVILDDLHPFSRKSKVHRTKIRTPDGHQWLAIPFLQEDRRKPIREVRIDDRRPWLRHHLQALEFNYRNSLYFDFYEPEIRADLTSAAECGLLLDAVRHLMIRQWIYLQLPQFPLWSSDNPSELDSAGVDSGGVDSGGMDSEGAASGEVVPGGVPSGPDVLADGQAILWQEPGSRHYQKPHPRAQDPGSDAFQPPEYLQHFPGFVPGCGVLDLLFEYGPDAWQVLDQLR